MHIITSSFLSIIYQTVTCLGIFTFLVNGALTLSHPNAQSQIISATFYLTDSIPSLKLLQIPRSQRPNWGLWQIAASSGEQYVPDHPGSIHGYSSSCVQPYTMVIPMILVHETDNPYRNGSYTLGCTEVTSMSTYLEAWNFSLTAGG
jgi:hypothetical protein